MYALYDTFNNRIVSRHRTVEAACKADSKLQRAVKRANGSSSYLPTRIMRIENGNLVHLTDCEMERTFCESAC